MNSRSDLNSLEASGLIQIAALQPELEYVFRHALVQEAAYATLLKQDRRSLHRVAAETIVALRPERAAEFAGVIGMHYELAGDAVPAATWLVTAGEHALERFATREAIDFFRRAWELTDDSQAVVRLRASIGGARAGWASKERGMDLERLERAVANGDSAEPRLLAEAYFWIAFMRRERGETPESSPGLQLALARTTELGNALGDAYTAALPRALMGAFDAFMGNLRRGAQEMQAAVDAMPASGDAVSRAMLSNFLVIAYARLGDFDAAERTLVRAEAFAGAADGISRLDVEIASSAIDLERGDIGQAFSRSLACANRAQDLGAYACVVAATVMYGAASVALDELAGAKDSLERGRDLSMLTNQTPMRTLLHGFLGAARARLGDVPGSVADWDTALDNARVMHDRYGEGQTFWARARALARPDAADWPAALRDINRAIELFEGMDARPALARTLHDRARVLRALGQQSESDAAERRALELGRQLGLTDIPFGSQDAERSAAGQTPSRSAGTA